MIVHMALSFFFPLYLVEKFFFCTRQFIVAWPLFFVAKRAKRTPTERRVEAMAIASFWIEVDDCAEPSVISRRRPSSTTPPCLSSSIYSILMESTGGKRPKFIRCDSLKNSETDK